MDNLKPIRILIADDHPMFRFGLRKFLDVQQDMTVIGEAGDGEQAVQLAKELHPNLLLLDLAMPRMPGLETLRALSESQHPVRTVLLTAAIEKAQIIQALQLGARGVVLKDTALEILLQAIRTVHEGRYWVGRDSVADLVEYLRGLLVPGEAIRNPFGLTPRELDILSAIVAGLGNRDIARKFSLSEDTVKHHLTHIFDKTGASNRLELAVLAIHRRLVDLSPPAPAEEKHE